MDTQEPIDYFKMFSDLMERRARLMRQRDQANIEIGKLKQLILSVFPMISESQQQSNQELIDAVEAEDDRLQDAIRMVFTQHRGEWLTISDVRNYLGDVGVSFAHYRANPLSSISTTLKRMIPDELETTNSGRGTLYKKRLTIGYRIAGYNDQPIVNNAIAQRLKDAGFVPINTPATDKLSKGPMRRAMARKAGVDPRPNSAYESGMRGDEKPKR